MGDLGAQTLGRGRGGREGFDLQNASDVGGKCCPFEDDGGDSGWV